MSNLVESFLNRSPRIDEWLLRQAKPFLEKNPTGLYSEDLEHIIDYLESTEAPRRINKNFSARSSKAVRRVDAEDE